MDSLIESLPEKVVSITDSKGRKGWKEYAVAINDAKTQFTPQKLKKLIEQDLKIGTYNTEHEKNVWAITTTIVSMLRFV